MLLLSILKRMCQWWLKCGLRPTGQQEKGSFFAKISNEIERRFYQEALSPDLKWRKQGLASLGRCCLIENAISPPNCEVFKPASKSGYPNIWCVDIFKKIWESSTSFLSWLRFMKVGKNEKNFHTFLLSSSLIHHLIGP